MIKRFNVLMWLVFPIRVHDDDMPVTPGLYSHVDANGYSPLVSQIARQCSDIYTVDIAITGGIEQIGIHTVAGAIVDYKDIQYRSVEFAADGVQFADESSAGRPVIENRRHNRNTQ